MTHNPKLTALADPKRFKTIQDMTRMRPDCGAALDDNFVIDNGALLIIDFTDIGDLLNPFNSPPAAYVRTHGVIVGSCKKDESCPLLWRDPYLLLPTSYHLKKDFSAYEEIGGVVGRVSCPSGSFLLLPVRPDLPVPFKGMVDEALEKGTGAKIKLPNGTCRVFYEQFEVPEGSKEEHYQNIVVQRQ